MTTTTTTETSNNLSLILEEIVENIGQESSFTFEDYFALIGSKMQEKGIVLHNDWFSDFIDTDAYGDETAQFLNLKTIEIEYNDARFFATFGVQYISEYDFFEYVEDRTVTLQTLTLKEEAEALTEKWLEEIKKNPQRLFATFQRFNLE